MNIQRNFAIILVLALVTAAAGCSLPGSTETSKAGADLDYPNQLFSYEKDDAVICNTWCPYDDAYLTRLREDYALEELVKDCKTEYEQVQVITGWVTNLWPHDGDHIPLQSDPLFILDSVTKDHQQYRCVEYGTVISGCLNALGIPTRTIGLKTRDMETREYGAGHVAAEAYLKDYGKWVFIDGQWGMIPLMGEMPLNAVQLGEVLQNPDKYDKSLEFLSFQAGSSSPQNYKDWIREYLYYFDVVTYTESEEGIQETAIMLTPAGSTSPDVFQRYYPLEIDTYTHSAASFYPHEQK